ncbi:MAG: hypothetical protein JW797_06295 [Bradymonadales bacterium]|nr:hypothetical protein [Bradymonadales bacterium]
MYSLLIGLGSGTLITLLVGFLLGYPRIVVWYGLIPGTIVAVGAFIYLSRRFGKQLERLMLRVQEDLQQKNPYKVEPGKIDRAIENLKQGYRFKRWLLLSRSQIDGQIGQLYYLDKRFDEAKPYLERAFTRNWIAKGMLAVLYYKRKQYDKMKQIFQMTVKATKKESLLWNLYAYCLWKIGERDAAIATLAKAGEILKDDPRIESNRLALQKNKKMKMRGWQEMWYQFHLEAPPQPKMQFDHKQMYRGR